MEFQFQTGAIKSGGDVTRRDYACTFQFQTGAIKSFASSKGYLLDPLTFQFQTGAIKRELRACQRVG